MKSSVLALIPARGGSKGLPKKNIRQLLGKPLVAWSIEQAKACAHIREVIVSTDDAAIAELAMSYGAAVPSLRPPEMATDESPVIDTALHVLDECEAHGRPYEVVVLLEPTSPLRAADDLDRALSEFLAKLDAYDSLVSLGEIHTESPYLAKLINADGFVTAFIEQERFYQRQQLPRTYFPYGVIYASKVSTLRVAKSFYQTRTMPYFIQRWQNYEVDDLTDFWCVEAIAQRKLGVSRTT